MAATDPTPPMSPLPLTVKALAVPWTFTGPAAATLRLSRQHWRALTPLIACRIGAMAGEKLLSTRLPDFDAAHLAHLDPAMLQAALFWGCMLLLFMLLSLLIISVVEPAVFFAIVQERETGRPASFVPALRWAAHKWATYTTCDLLVTLAVACTLPLLVFPGVMIYTRAFLTGPIIVCEPAGTRQAWRASARAMRAPQRAAVIKSVAVFVLAAVLVQGLVKVLSSVLPSAPVDLAGEVLTNVIAALWCVSPLTFYLALRQPEAPLVAAQA